MSNDQHLTSDLPVTDEDAESIVGGKVTKPAHKNTKTTKAATYKVDFISVPGGVNPTPVDTESMDSAQDC